ncbi:MULTISPECIES: Ms4533A family Cys-rich leader peptide [Catenulispora]|nr:MULTISPECIES: Ms4533A family Cys-rich leader peptide [Catenulispora]
MSSIIATRMAFLERALLAVTNHCVADILCSR